MFAQFHLCYWNVQMPRTETKNLVNSCLSMFMQIQTKLPEDDGGKLWLELLWCFSLLHWTYKKQWITPVRFTLLLAPRIWDKRKLWGTRELVRNWRDRGNHWNKLKDIFESAIKDRMVFGVRESSLAEMLFVDFPNMPTSTPSIKYFSSHERVEVLLPLDSISPFRVRKSNLICKINSIINDF